MFGSTRRSLAICLASALLALASAAPARAGYVASNLGAGDSFGPAAYDLTGARAPTGLGYGLAVRFAVTGPGPVAFGSARLALSFHGGANAVDVLLMSDLGGLPGSALEAIRLEGIAPGPSLVEARSTTFTTLSPARSYWLAAVASNDTHLSWSTNGLGRAGDLAYRVDFGSGPGAWGAAPLNLDPAFAISTATVTAVTVVPAPPSLALFGLGLLALIGAREWSVVGGRWPVKTGKNPRLGRLLPSPLTPTTDH